MSTSTEAPVYDLYVARLENPKELLEKIADIVQKISEWFQQKTVSCVVLKIVKFVINGHETAEKSMGNIRFVNDGDQIDLSYSIVSALQDIISCFEDRTLKYLQIEIFAS